MTKQHVITNKDMKDVKILIIEDNLFCIQGLQLLLEQNGISNITIATTGNEAVKLFSERFDLIFMDINLPDINGIKLTHEIRKGTSKTDTPIICCSSSIDSKRRECIDAGMDDFISKPPTAEGLQEILDCWLPHLK